MWRTIFLDETGRLRTAWRFLNFFVGYLMVQLFAGIGVGVCLLVWLALSGQTDVLAGPDAILTLETEYTVPLMVLAAAPLTALAFGLVVFCRRLLDRRSVRSLGLVRPGRRPLLALAIGFLAGLGPMALSVGLLCLIGGYRLTGVAVPPLAVALVPTLVLMAFHEEIVVRGYLMQNLIDIGRPAWAVLFSSLFFWLMHSLNPDVWSSPLIPLNMFGAGVALALAYRASGNIWFPTAMHFGWNLGQGVLFSVPVSGIAVEGFITSQRNPAAPDWLTGGTFGLEGSILGTASEAVLIVLFLGVLQVKRPAVSEVARTNQNETVAAY